MLLKATIWLDARSPLALELDPDEVNGVTTVERHPAIEGAAIK